jgi:hypothetical protein
VKSNLQVTTSSLGILAPVLGALTSMASVQAQVPRDFEHVPPFSRPHTLRLDPRITQGLPEKP